MEFENLLILIKTVSDSELTDFAYEENGTSIHLKKKKETVVVAGNQPDVPIAGLAAAQAAASPATVNAETVQAASSEPEGMIVKSPLVAGETGRGCHDRGTRRRIDRGSVGI